MSLLVSHRSTNITSQSEGSSSGSTIGVSGDHSRHGVATAYARLNAGSCSIRGPQTFLSRLSSRTVASLPSIPVQAPDLKIRFYATIRDAVLGRPVQSVLERVPAGMPSLVLLLPSLGSQIMRDDEFTPLQLPQMSDASAPAENEPLSCTPIVSVEQQSAVAASLPIFAESISVLPGDHREECRLHKLKRSNEESLLSSLWRAGSSSSSACQEDAIALAPTVPVQQEQSTSISSSQAEQSLDQDEMDYDIVRDFEDDGEVLVSKPVIPQLMQNHF